MDGNDPQLLVDWPAIGAAGVAAVGGKAATLARLAELQFDVPPGLAVPAAVHRAWLEAADALPEAARAAALPSQAHAAALQALRDRLVALGPPPALVDALARALAQPPWAGAALAVRSSAPQEDSAQASFAGIHRTELNRRGTAAVAAAVVQVWASLWTPAAMAYRARLGLAPADAAMAVLVMPLVDARAAGIAFTADPATGRGDRLLVHANAGLGQSLVDGDAEGDEAVMALRRGDDELSLLSYRIGAKLRHTVAAAGGGTEARATPPAEAAARVLDDTQVLRLGRLLRLVATALGDAQQPQDIEWAWDGERFWLLQARPITALPRCTYPALEGLPDIWSRGNTVDVVPEPLSPIEWHIALGTANAMLEGGWRVAGYALHPGVQRFRIIDGRMYLNMSVIQWESHDAFGLTPAATNRLVGGHQPEIPVPAPDARARRRHALHKLRYALRTEALRRRGRRQVQAIRALQLGWRERPLPHDDAAMAAALRSLGQTVQHSDGMLFMQGAGGGALSMLVDLIDARLPGRGHALASALLAGGKPSVSAQQGLDLVRLAALGRADPLARAWLARPGAERGDWQQALPAGHPLREALAAWLRDHGHRGIYETYLRNPRWIEAPGPLLDSLPALADTDLAALDRRRREAAADAWRELRAAMPWWRRLLLRGLLRPARRDSLDREAARSGFIAGVEPMRRLLLELGRRWAGLGWLARDDDVWLLMSHEILAVLDGVRPGAALRPLAAGRRARFDAWLRTPARELVIDGDEAALRPGSDATAGVGPADATLAGTVLRGVAVGSGRARGPARRIRSPDAGAALQPGDILVAPSTDPAWVPLFLRAAGLVMETGGFLSHGAIVAREFGIPAVVNLPGVLGLLRDGEALEVDGGAGTVTRLGER